MTYKLGQPFMNEPATSVCHVETGRWIPFDPDNIDYQEYLEWVAEGNTPLPADD